MQRLWCWRRRVVGAICAWHTQWGCVRLLWALDRVAAAEARWCVGVQGQRCNMGGTGLQVTAGSFLTQCLWYTVLR